MASRRARSTGRRRDSISGGPERRPAIVAAIEERYCRHPDESVTTESLLAAAFGAVTRQAGVARDEVDGLGVASFTLVPDRAIDLAWKLGLRLRWVMDDGNGGASGIELLQHAMRAVESGDASTVVLLAADRFDRSSFRALTDHYNRVTERYLTSIPTGGPNALFAMLTRLQMRRHGLERADYGRVATAQRRWATLNPGAVYRQPLSLAQYLEAPAVAPPLHRYDCVPVVSGADALVVRADECGVVVRAIGACHNVDLQDGDGLSTGLRVVAPRLFDEAGRDPEEMDVISVYDDYPAMVLAQLADLGYAPDGDLRRLAARLDDGSLAVNTSGGQLSAGQAGAAGGMHGLVEVVGQLLRRAGRRQLPDARLGLVTGYGMVLYRYGGCANAVVLEARR